jgi:hypothetical protein
MIVVTKDGKRYVYDMGYYTDVSKIENMLKEYITDKRYSISTIALQLKYGGVDINCQGINFRNMARVIMDKNTIEMKVD